MATKFRTFDKEVETPRPFRNTIFNYCVLKGDIYATETTVNSCKEVIFLGHDNNAGKDVFLALFSTGGRTIYYGTKGDEFD